MTEHTRAHTDTYPTLYSGSYLMSRKQHLDRDRSRKNSIADSKCQSALISKHSSPPSSCRCNGLCDRDCTSSAASRPVRAFGAKRCYVSVFADGNVTVRYLRKTLRCVDEGGAPMCVSMVILFRRLFLYFLTPASES